MAKILRLFLISLVISSNNGATDHVTTNRSYLNNRTNVIRSTQLPANDKTSKDDECVVLDISLTNCTCNYANYDNSCKIDDADRTIFSLVYSSITVACCGLGVIGNIAVLIIAVKRHKNLSHNNIILAELAAIDFLLCIILFIDRSRTFWYDDWPYGVFVCKLIKGGTLLCEMLVGGLILMMTIERFLGILHPIKSRRIKAKMTRVLFPLNIVASTAVVVPAIIGYHINADNGNCEFKPYLGRTSALVYTWFQFGFFYLAMIFFTFIFLCIILRFLRRQSEIFQLGKMKDIRQRRIRDNYRMIYIAILLMLSFVIFVYPIRILGVYLVSTDYDTHNLNCYWLLVYIAYVTNPFHVMLFPIFYCIIDRNWRDEVLDLFHLSCCRRESRVNFDDERGSFNMIGRLSSIVDNGR